MKMYFTTLLLLIFSCQARVQAAECPIISLEDALQMNELRNGAPLNNQEKIEVINGKVRQINSMLKDKAIKSSSEVKACKQYRTALESQKKQLASSSQRSHDIPSSGSADFNQGDTVYFWVAETYRGYYFAEATVESVAKDKIKVTVDRICSNTYGEKRCGFDSLSGAEYMSNKTYWVYKSDVSKSEPNGS